MLDRQNGFGRGFDFLRVALATCVVAWHTNYVVNGNLSDTNETWFVWFPGYGILVMFFALSGFLIAASGLRLSLKNFLINRGLRIIPALAVEIVLSALILGPLFTTLPLSYYFADLHTYQYFTNVVGIVNYFLPGVFAGNPAPEVNNSLWTVPFEYLCYAMMAMFMMFGLLRKPALIVVGAALFLSVGLVLHFTGHVGPAQYIPTAAATQTPFAKIFSTTVFLGRGGRLLAAFMLGIAAFLYRDKLPYDWRIFTACTLLCLGAAMLGPAPWMTQPILNATICPALVYITAFLGVSKLPQLPLFSRGDYSYGIYLYGFPVQQAVATLLPSAGCLAQFGVAMVLITMFAAVSWHGIEKPILKLRRRFSFVARERLAPNDVGKATMEGTSIGFAGRPLSQ